MDGLYWKILFKWMIWGYLYFRKPPFHFAHVLTVLGYAIGLICFCLLPISSLLTNFLPLPPAAVHLSVENFNEKHVMLAMFASFARRFIMGYTWLLLISQEFPDLHQVPNQLGSLGVILPPGFDLLRLGEHPDKTAGLLSATNVSLVLVNKKNILFFCVCVFACA